MWTDSRKNLTFTFGPFRFLPSRRVLTHHGQPVKVGNRALDILHLLVIRSGEPVSKKALIEFAWPNVFVDDSNLKVHISSLRRALKDTLPQATYIATVAGRGYQFVSPVEATDGEAAEFSGEYQLMISDLPEPSSLIGRERDIEGVAQALDFSRLLTLVGPGGVGKTSLAIAVAHTRHHEFTDGVHFADLSTTDNPAQVPQLVAACLGLRGNSPDLIAAIKERLLSRRILIVLDNCEHVLHAIANVAAQLVGSKMRSCLLATSREPLGVAGETLQYVGPLVFPRHEDTRWAKQALTFSSIKLFALRALERADYHLTDKDAQAVAHLCEALDGLPLAIEIAAANLDQFSPVELLHSVHYCLGELNNADEASHLHSRHRTLWAMLDWSYSLLSEQESTLFKLLSVFVGPFEWTDVTGMARLADYDPYQTTLALGGLVSKSLLSADIDGEQLRYRLLQSTRTYAAHRLQEDPLAYNAQLRHAEIMLSAFEKSELEWTRADSRIWRARYQARTGDLNKALDWCFTNAGHETLGIDLVIAAIRLWNEQSSLSEQRSQVRRALEHCAVVTEAPKRRAALAASWAWSMTHAQLLRDETDAAWETAVSYAKLSNDKVQYLSAMFGRSMFLIHTGRNEEALRLLSSFDQIADGDRAYMIDGERMRAVALMHLGKLVNARGKLEGIGSEISKDAPPSRLGRYRENMYVGSQSTLAFLTWLIGRPETALAMIQEMVSETGQVKHLIGQCYVLGFVALPLAAWSGRTDLLNRYSALLQSNLDREYIATWELGQKFYASVGRHRQGDPTGLENMRAAVDELIHARFLRHTPMYLGVMAESYLESGKLKESEESVELALVLHRESDEVWCSPELLRVKAARIAMLGERNEARQILSEAREQALANGARTFELRIVNDLAEIEMAEGRAEKAFELLTPIHRYFRESTATEDLKKCARFLEASRSSHFPTSPPF